MYVVQCTTAFVCGAPARDEKRECVDEMAVSAAQLQNEGQKHTEERPPIGLSEPENFGGTTPRMAKEMQLEQEQQSHLVMGVVGGEAQ